MRKLFIPFLLCAVMLCGCGKSEKKLKIGISVPAATHGWTGGVVWHAEQRLLSGAVIIIAVLSQYRKER